MGVGITKKLNFQATRVTTFYDCTADMRDLHICMCLFTLFNLLFTDSKRLFVLFAKHTFCKVKYYTH
jgi:hypothetical protein